MILVITDPIEMNKETIIHPVIHITIKNPKIKEINKAIIIIMTNLDLASALEMITIIIDLDLALEMIMIMIIDLVFIIHLM